MFRKDTELNFIASDGEEGGLGMEELSDDGVREGFEAGTGNVQEGQGDREERDGDLHGREGTQRRGGGPWLG